MNINNLQENGQKLLDHMKTVGYSQNYIQQIRREMRLIIEGHDRWSSYEDIIKDYESIYDSAKAEKLRVEIRLIARFDLEDKLPRDEKNPRDRNYYNNAYSHLLPEFKELLDFYRANADYKIKKQTTVQSDISNTAAFLHSLQHKGIDSLAKIDESCITEMFLGEDERPVRSASYARHLRSVFKGAETYNDECKRIRLLLPEIRKRRKTIQYFTQAERVAVKRTFKEQNCLSLRDKAIGCLLYYTGLRCSDISNLKFSDINWEKEEVSIIQQKTGVPLRLPLTAIVGNAIYDYVVKERGDSDCEYIFLSKNYPFGKITSSAVGQRSAVILKEAGIRQNPGDRKGGHIFRHNFATSMLEKGVPKADISHALGHSSPDSTDAYFSADMVHLKALALGIEEFPVRKGVFSSERI